MASVAFLRGYLLSPLLHDCIQVVLFLSFIQDSLQASHEEAASLENYRSDHVGPAQSLSVCGEAVTAASSSGPNSTMSSLVRKDI